MKWIETDRRFGDTPAGLEESSSADEDDAHVVRGCNGTGSVNCTAFAAWLWQKKKTGFARSPTFPPLPVE